MTGIMMAVAGTQAAGSGAVEGIRVNLTNHFVDSVDTNGSPWNFDASFTLRNSGRLDLASVSDGPPPTDPLNEWITGFPDTVEAALYECLVSESSQNGGATRTGTMDTWLDCALADSLRVWQITKSSGGDADWVLTVSVRSKSSMTVHDTATITMRLIDGFS